MFHLALPRPLLPFKFDKPALPTPLFKLPKAREKQSPKNASNNPLHFIFRFFFFFFSIPLRVKGGETPLWTAYAVHSPLLPLQDSRTRMCHPALPRPLQPCKSDKPAKPTPKYKAPKASHSLSATVDVGSL